MRSRVVFGRGGPRGPPRMPSYLLMQAPVLKHRIGSPIKGNRFEILASIPEKSEHQHSQQNLHIALDPTSVVHADKIPNSISTSVSSKSPTLIKPVAPEYGISSVIEDSNGYTKVVRGRAKSQFFNKKIKQSKQFTQKLKESLFLNSTSPRKSTCLVTSPPQLFAQPHLTQATMTSAQPSPSSGEPHGVGAHSSSEQYGTNMDIDDVDDQRSSPDSTLPETNMNPSVSTPDEFDLTPEEEDALLSDDVSPPPPKPSSLQASLSANTVQPDIKRFFSSTKNSNIPSVPETLPGQAMNVGSFTSVSSPAPIQTSTDFTSHPSIQEQEVEHITKVPVRANSKMEITCRFKIRIGGGTCNLPLLVKQVVKLYRGVDSSLAILPILDPENDAFILNSEDSIPETEDELKKWVTYVVSHHERVHFTMRFSIMKSLSAISGPIFAWMKLNRSYVKMDTIRSEKIVTLGFFEGFHPDFQSRDSFKKYCFSHILSKNKTLHNFTMDDFSMYPRAVYVGSTVDKVTTRAMVIEVSSDHSSQVLSSLSSSFSNSYTDVTFIPFTKMDDEYQVILKMAMMKQNKFLHTLKRKQIKGLVNPHKLLTKKDGQEISLCRWLQSARSDSDGDDESPIIQSVEENKYSSSSILYFEKHAEKVLQFCKNLKSNMEDHFPPSALDQVFTHTYSPAPNNLSRIISDEESTWAAIIKRKYLPNPQDDGHYSVSSHAIPPSKLRKSVYYGSTKTPSSLREDTHIQLEGVNESESVGSLTSELSLKYQELEKQVQSLLKSQEQNQIETKTYVDNSIAAMEENLNAQFQENTTMIKQQISTLETNSINQFSVLTQTLNSVAGNVNILLSSFNLNGTSTSNQGQSTTTTAQGIAVGSGKH